MTYLFPPEAPYALPMAGSEVSYPVRRIFCVGRNYVAHAAEMGGEVDREAPWYFTKSPHGLAQSGVVVPYPKGTQNFHHEVELVVALGSGAEVLGYACGLDMTRRDLQQIGKDNRRPWSLGKDLENGSVIGSISQVSDTFDASDGAIELTVNGDLRQSGRLSDMVWSVPEIIDHLSGYYDLGAGDIIMTGTPSGVGPVIAGDRLVGRIDGLEDVVLELA